MSVRFWSIRTTSTRRSFRSSSLVDRFLTGVVSQPTPHRTGSISPCGTASWRLTPSWNPSKAGRHGHCGMDQWINLPTYHEKMNTTSNSNQIPVMFSCFFLEPRGTRLKWPISSPCRIRLEIGGLITCLVFICIYIYIYIMLYMYDLVISDVVSQ